MMTQADVLASNDEAYSSMPIAKSPVVSYEANTNQETIQMERPPKPVGFDSKFPELNALNLTEHSPIRPSKYLATDSAINSYKSLRKIIIGGCIFSLVITIALVVQILIGSTQVPHRIGIVTQEKICSDIGADMVKRGGNSIDAFIASSLCLSVVNPFSSGLGAGGFLLIRDHKHERNFAYNCFFKSSSKLILKEYETSPTGKKSIAVPGELKCLQNVYHKFARFYWKTLAAPAIKLATNGFAASKLLIDHLKELDLDKDIKADPVMQEMFMKDGNLITEGAIVTNFRLARTLELLVNKENIFYIDGEIGRETVNDLTDPDTKEQPFTTDDLRSYSVREETPISASYNDFVLLSSPSPSNGPIFKFILDLMQTLKIKINDFTSSSDVYLNILKAARMAYIMSNYLGDPQYNTNQVELFNERLTQAVSYFGTNSSFPFSETNMKLKDDIVNNFIGVNDDNDLMVSYVGTLGSAWGSRILTKNGFFLNNGMNLFSYRENNQNYDSSNSVNTEKQPRGLIAPILTYNKKNPCIRRFSISYGHHGVMPEKTDDYGLSELTQVILKIFTDFALYENSISDKRVQYSENENGYCYENGLDSNLVQKLDAQFKPSNSCSFHSIDLVMKKDHVIYGQADVTRSQDSLVLLN